MNKREKIVAISSAIAAALSKYDVDNVDIVKDVGRVDIIYHSENNSFPIVGNVCSTDGLRECDVRKIASEYGIGYCW